eukprot:3059754-Rhodomonas_salina.1
MLGLVVQVVTYPGTGWAPQASESDFDSSQPKFPPTPSGPGLSTTSYAVTVVGWSVSSGGSRLSSSHDGFHLRMVDLSPSPTAVKFERREI